MGWEDYICYGCLYVIEDEDTYAVSRLSDKGGLIVFAGSHFPNKCTEGASGIVSICRSYPKKAGCLVLLGNQYRFIRDYEYRCASQASIAILGDRIPASYAWKRK